ncbi:hypothetical protein ACRQ5D_34330 [Mucilaginibacter sp. P25]|uniref:hypothetical protein n=1 Tax=Mucilaginibacter sp. P25 TaxID=3423945 RepID=UPI003D7BAC2A
METPIDDLKHWFLALAPTEQNNLGVIDHFAHSRSKPSIEQHEYAFGFLTQLGSFNLEPKETIHKTLFFSNSLILRYMHLISERHGKHG